MKNIVVTGASKGIGKSIAGKFAAGGWNVAICARTTETLLRTKSELQEINPSGRILAESVDMSRSEEVKRFAGILKKDFGIADVLVNNAGVFFPGTIHEEMEGVLEDMMAVNLYSAYYLSRALLPEMKEKRSGHIVNICSTASLKAYSNGGSYSISKFALLGFSKNLREELKPFNIKVTAVCPGPTLTDSWTGFEGPADRMMPPADVAELIWTICNLAPQTVTEDIIMRPMQGDIS